MRIRIVLRVNMVRVMLVRRGKTQAWLAERVGVSPSHLYHAMLGKKGVGPNVANAVARALGAEWDQVARLEEAER